MRVAFVFFLLPFCALAQGPTPAPPPLPTCVCDDGFVYDSNDDTFVPTQSGGSGDWTFKNCIKPTKDPECDNGENGPEHTRCIKERTDPSERGGTLLDASIQTAIDAAKTAVTEGPQQTDYSSRIGSPSNFKSACCANCNKGYRMQEVKQTSAAGEHVVGYICVEQWCANGLTDFSVDPPKCTCKAGFFRSDYTVSDLVTPVNTTKIEAQVDKVKSTAMQFENYLGQPGCIAYSASNCYAPRHCKPGEGGHDATNNCQSRGAPHATLCGECANGYNRKSVLCSDSAIDFDSGAHEAKNECHLCVLPKAGCASGTIKEN